MSSPSDSASLETNICLRNNLWVAYVQVVEEEAGETEKEQPVKGTLREMWVKNLCEENSYGQFCQVLLIWNKMKIAFSNVVANVKLWGRCSGFNGE